jgi:hypothetical protein
MGLTFDTGALIGLERSRHYMRKVYDVAVSHDVRITVPSVVVAEWWRAGVKERSERGFCGRSRSSPSAISWHGWRAWH